LDFELTEDLEAVRGLARDVAQREFAPMAAELDKRSRFPVESFSRLGELGLLGVNVPEEYGGSEMGALALTVALEEVAAACASTAVAMSVTNMVGETLCRFGNDEQKRRLVPDLTAGRHVVGAFCLSEAGSGSDAAALATTARRDGDHYVLNGTKAWVTSGSYAGVLICMARTGGPEAGHRGISAFILQPGMEGFSTGKPEDKCGLRGSNTVSVILEDCRVPVANLLGEEGMGFQIAMAALDGGRITIGSMANGIARAAGEVAAAYALEREAFGRPIAEFQAIGHKLADMATGLDASRLLVCRAAWLKEAAASTGRRFTLEAAMAKVFATENAKKGTEEAVQILGGYGYIREYPVERYMRDARVTTIFEGTTEIQKIVIAREILKAIA
jgi:alkylation response protein AidB-like acyl-CoA dehydrogenase